MQATTSHDRSSAGVPRHLWLTKKIAKPTVTNWSNEITGATEPSEGH